MAPNPKLFLDISKSNSTPPADPRPNRHHKPVTNYVDLVAKLRNPTAAGPINKRVATGRNVGHPVGVADSIRRRPKLQRSEPKVSAEAYENFFDEDMSGSLSGAMGGYAAARLNQTREEKTKMLQECEESRGVSQQDKFEEQPCKVEKSLSYRKPVIERYPYPAETYTRDRSNEEYLALFAALAN